jgi:GrpB-like predicted nucleotidyltransferase (UPF0157 family)/ribosomal protein S18 acetylase RimI-like enzyme
VQVRKASGDDAAAIADIHVRSWQAAYRGALPDELLDGLAVAERARSWREILAAGDERWLTFVAEPVAGGLAGFCAATMPSRDADAGDATAEIGALYVDPDHWRDGVGSALLAFALEALNRAGWRDAILWVLPENHDALAFYKRFGFEIEKGVEKCEERSRRRVIRLRAALAEAEKPIEVVPYDPRWPERFGVERDALEEAIGKWATGGIHHVGSTAVPGLDAKPIIDIVVGVDSLEAARACFEPLARLGYLYAPYRVEEMHWFCKPHPRRRTNHLHLVPTESKRFRDELVFRDALRASPDLAKSYAVTKRRLAARFKHDREGYTDAKESFIRSVLRDG